MKNAYIDIFSNLFERDVTDGNLKMISLKEKKKLERVTELYGAYIYRVCLKMLKDPHDAEDAAQNTYIKLVAYLSKIDDIESKATKVYIYKTADSVCKNMLRKGKVCDVGVSEEDMMAVEAREAADAIAAEYAENNCIDKLTEYLKPLSQSERDLLEYYAYTGDTLEATARHFGIRYDRCRKQMERIRKKIKKHILEIESEEAEQENDMKKFKGSGRLVYKDPL